MRRSLNKFSAEVVLNSKAVVSLAYCEILNSLSYIFIPRTFSSYLMAFAKISVQRVKRILDSGQSCLTTGSPDNLCVEI